MTLDSTAPDRPPSPETSRKRRPGPLLIAVLAVLGVLLVLAAALYLNRRAAARELLVGWLERQGVDADVTVERIELDGLTARIRIGDPADPDFAAERVEVDYAITSPWSRTGLGLTPSRIRLVRPILRARWDGKRFSLGSLDPIVKDFTDRPPRPDSRGPLVVVERGRVALDTPQGRINAQADARVDDGKLMRLTARLPQTNLRPGATTAQGLAGSLDLTTRGDRMAVRFDLGAQSAALPGLSLTAGRINGTGDLPYPDMKARRGDGRALLSLTLAAGTLDMGATSLRGVGGEATLDGTTAGWLDTLRFAGEGRARLSAAGLTAPGASAQGAAVALDVARLDVRQAEGETRWEVVTAVSARAAAAATGEARFTSLNLTSRRLSGGGSGTGLEVQGPVDVAATGFRFGDLALKGVRGRVDLDAGHSGATLIRADGGLTAAGGAWPLFGPRAADDVPELAAMKAALGDFAVSVPAFRLAVGSPGVTVDLARPVTLSPRNGGMLTMSTRNGAPVYSAGPGERGGGALNLTATRGAGLPEAAFAVPEWRLTADGFTARLDGRAALNFGIGRGIALTTRGLLASGGGRLTYASADCAAVTVERLELGENDVTDVSGDLCPRGGPLVTVADGGWRADVSFSGVDASAPFMAAQFSEASGRLAVVGAPGGLGLTAEVERAAVSDATQPRRFNPLTATGSAQLRDENWTGAFDLSSGPHAVGRVSLNHDGRAEAGGVVISAPDLTFVEGGLQPSDLSPLVEPFVQPPVTGSAAFEGRIDWTGDGEGTSGGRLSVSDLDFVSPAGPVAGVNGTIDFTSLIPLTTAPDQTLTAERLETVTPLTDLELVFGLDKAGVTVSAGDIRAAGGVVRVEPFTVPLDPGQGFSGVIVLDRVQLGEILAGSGFGDKASMDAVVSGRLPFTSDRNGVRVTGGTLNAVQPGRLSIQREALSGVEAGGGGEAVPPNTVQDLAYQAMENLAFDVLTAEVNSRDEGRLGVLFHIRGRHDPPQRQELRVSLPELISREFLNRELPLPSGTEIDLTLDTTLNANQLVSDLMALNRARNGEADAAEPDAEP